MKTIVVYATRHGCTKDAARRLATHLGGEPRLVDLKQDGPPDLANWEAVAIGGSIYAGKIQKSVARFMEHNRAVLLEKRLGLFFCCMEEGVKAANQFANVFPADLAARASTMGFFGGRFDFSRMSWMERWIVRRTSGVKESVDKLNEENIIEFAARLKGGGKNRP
jgi:menaquinone-dependent protoporphyrinogen oxidase